LGIQAAHLLGDIAHAQKIEDGQHHTVENRQDERSRPFADLAMIFAQGHISPPVQPVFYGPMPANDF
jgi:hypothetical protein